MTNKISNSFELKNSSRYLKFHLADYCNKTYTHIRLLNNYRKIFSSLKKDLFNVLKHNFACIKKKLRGIFTEYLCFKIMEDG